MQLSVRVEPSYEDGFKKVYPGIAKRLHSVGESALTDGPSLLGIVEKWDVLLSKLDGDPAFKKLLLRHKGRLRELYQQVEERIVDWHLSEADRMLYEVEDIFGEIDREAADL
jgi:hypothetical protein